MEMVSFGEKADVTAQLPDEVLRHVFSFLSLSDKLRSEAVSHKFQRCVLGELSAKPQPFELNLCHSKFNGYEVPHELIFGAVQTLAKKAKFSSIGVRVMLESEQESMEQMGAILSLLISEDQCLSKVTSIMSNASCNQTLLENFLDKCEKLSTINFQFGVRPLNSEPANNRNIYPLDLGQLLKNRRLIELELGLFRYDQAGTTHMFQAIKPNALRKVNLGFEQMPELNMAQLVDALGPNLSALEEINFLFTDQIQLTDLLKSLARLPALHKCDIDCFFHNHTAQQLVPAVTPLFRMGDIKVTVKAMDLSFAYLPGCQVVNMIRQVQTAHPGLVVDFHQLVGALILSQGNASIQMSFSFAVGHCGAVEDCVLCQSYYPTLFIFLRSQAQHRATLHFPNWRLDRCRFDKVLDDLKFISDLYGNSWRPLSVEASEDQQSVTINFETRAEHHLFTITVGCGPCLSNGCVKCEI